MKKSKLILVVPSGNDVVNDPRIDEVRVDTSASGSYIIREEVLTAPGANGHLPNEAVDAYLNARNNGNPQDQLDALFEWVTGVTPDDAADVVGEPGQLGGNSQTSGGDS